MFQVIELPIFYRHDSDSNLRYEYNFRRKIVFTENAPLINCGCSFVKLDSEEHFNKHIKKGLQLGKLE